MACKRVDEELAVMKEVLKKMCTAVLIQSNMTAVVKVGMKQRENSLDVIQCMRSILRVSKECIHQHTKAKDG